MKTKHLLSIILVAVLPNVGSVSAQVSAITVTEEPVELRPPVREDSVADPLIRAAGSSDTPFLSERLTVSSLCVGTSPHVIQSRRNVIGGLIGMTVNVDPTHPEGWYVIPADGWQWHHLLASTTFSMWRGKTVDLTTMQATQRGNRMVISATLQYPVSAYRCRITSTLTNVAPTEFVIGRDSQTGQELQFNANFVGRDYGADNILESTYDPVTGIWTERGDDLIFSNGELPSAVMYDDAVRVGATVVVSIGNMASVDQVRNQFIAGVPTLTADLIKFGDVVDTQVVQAELPRLTIVAAPHAPQQQTSSVLMSVVAGQDDVVYHFQSTRDFETWNEYDLDVKKGQGVSSDVPLDQFFFRLRSILP